MAGSLYPAGIAREIETVLVNSCRTQFVVKREYIQELEVERYNLY